MRFECGIENKFECSVCQKRFPYKQNAGIHLKRKHKVQLETPDDMLAAGKIIQISSIPKQAPWILLNKIIKCFQLFKFIAKLKNVFLLEQ